MANQSVIPFPEARAATAANWLGIPPEKMAIVQQAVAILDEYWDANHKPFLSNPRETENFLKLKIGTRPYEVFGCVFLDNGHRVLGLDELFRGTISSSSVFPREVVRAALAYNCAAVVFFHNHPSGASIPSAADRAITHELRDALQLVDVHVLDHFVIGSGAMTSMAEKGLI